MLGLVDGSNSTPSSGAYLMRYLPPSHYQQRHALLSRRFLLLAYDDSTDEPLIQPDCKDETSPPRYAYNTVATMPGIPQRLRPKHQILILKCYPRMQKSTEEIKPNSSELSYLLYYASTRRTKLQKVGTFLEKKTVSDVASMRLGNIQVTLQIITAILEKCPRDLPLYIESVLHILSTILTTHDINLIEASLPAFGALCKNYDSATLSADKDLTRRYDAIIKTYASFASRTTPFKIQGRSPSVPEAIRFRSAGLSAIKSMVTSDCFVADSGKHLRVFMPYILENLHAESPGYLSLLRNREASQEQLEKEQIQAQRHRPSLSLTRASESQMEVDPVIAAGTAADVDKRADEEVGVLAMQSLRHIFVSNNRSQARAATSAILDFTMSHAIPTYPTTLNKSYSRHQRTWSTELFELICRWTPVQDRYVILISAMDSLVRRPIVEDDLANQLELTKIIGWLLRSNINFIGLSVMDLLIGLIQHILLLLQLGGHGANVTPHYQQTSRVSLDQPHTVREAYATSSSVVMEVVPNASPSRVELLSQLQHCVGDLATHVYYADQISDMVAAILLRLKPSPSSVIPTAAAAVENPTGAADAIADSIHLHEKPNTDGFFSFDTARLLALKAVTEILVVSNSRRKDHTGAIGRNRVDMATWEGTQWLLRDPDGRVRKAYLEALLTWLKLEVDKDSLHLLDEHSSPRSKKKDADTNSSPVARRAISNASQRSRTQPRVRSFFLQLLHLAVYESALQYADSEADIQALHLLLVNIVQKLGVNSIRTSLPMIFRLQEDMNHMPSLVGRVALGSLVHGYFWALSEIYGFENTILGRDIHAEIQRRTSANLWYRNVRVPPLGFESIGDLANANIRSQINEAPRHGQQLPVLQPFDARHAIIDAIAEGYERSAVLSPPTSPLPTPSKGMSYMSTVPSLNPVVYEDRSLPGYIRDEMLSHWTKEECLASFTAHETARASSMTGSRSSPRYPHSPLSPYGNVSTVSNASVGNIGEYSTSRNDSIGRSSTHSLQYGVLPHASASRIFSTVTGEQHSDSNRRLSRHSSDTPVSASSASRSIVHVADLKRALDGSQGLGALSLTGFTAPRLYDADGNEIDAASREPYSAGGDVTEDNASDSMVSFSASFDDGEGSFTGFHGGHNGVFGGEQGATGDAYGVIHDDNNTDNPTTNISQPAGSYLTVNHNAAAVPHASGSVGEGTRFSGSALGRRGGSVRSKMSTKSAGDIAVVAGPKDVMELLNGIDEGDRGRRTVVSVLGKPPY